ncbi:MAG: PAS-domain containing protein [Pseudomonadota bacterium]
MEIADITLGLAVVGTSVLSAVLVLVAMERLRPPRRVTWTPFAEAGDSVAFLFDDEDLVDATPQGQALLAQGPEQMEDWPRLALVLRDRFPDLSEQLSGLGEAQRIDLLAPDGATRLTAEWRSGLTRIEIGPSLDAVASDDSVAAAALMDEVHDLRATLDAAPLPVWKQDAGGAVRWANASYIELALRKDPECDTLAWPLPRLFSRLEAVASKIDTAQTVVPAQTSASPSGRVSLTLPPAQPDEPAEEHWFDIHEGDATEAGLFYAIPADKLVKTEHSLAEFVQTLSKTFAHLPTGLAVFDKNRRLALFNPALTDLSNLPPLFLSRRPTLFEFLDHLREAQRMPEPKDYRDWRRKISDMESAAASGTHIETWSLPNGQTFRVTGRPHPDGAVAFLFQDITSEVSLTRRFRSELELGQSVLDSLDEAIVVFSPSGALVSSNRAYDRLWFDAGENAGDAAQTEALLGSGASNPGETSFDAAGGLEGANLQNATRLWQAACQPAPLWADLRDFASRSDDRTAWTADLRLLDGRNLACRVVPLSGNATLVGFAPQTPRTTRPIAPVSRADAKVRVDKPEPTAERTRA